MHVVDHAYNLPPRWSLPTPIADATADRICVAVETFCQPARDDGDRRPCRGIPQQAERRRKILRHLDQHDLWPQLAEGGSKMARAGGAVMADGEEMHPILRGDQPLGERTRFLRFHRRPVS